MSTSSGRKGFCDRCRHANNEHTREREAKCKKCKKVFEICQIGVHGDESSPGWRICFIPCSCGEKYYPDKAKGTLPLQPHEYVETHPGYRPLYPPEEESSAIFDNSQTETYETGGFVSSPQQEEPVSAIEASYGHTRSASEESNDPLVFVSTPQKVGSGSKTKAFHGHTRSESEGSIDELAWSPKTYHDRTIDPVEELAEDLYYTRIDDLEPEAGGSGIGPWSSWTWNDTYGCNYRYRKNPVAEGGYDYDYETTTAGLASSSSKHRDRKGKGKGKQR